MWTNRSPQHLGIRKSLPEESFSKVVKAKPLLEVTKKWTGGEDLETMIVYKSLAEHGNRSPVLEHYLPLHSKNLLVTETNQPHSFVSWKCMVPNKSWAFHAIQQKVTGNL